MRMQQNLPRVRSFGVILSLALVWEVSGRLGLISTLFFPTPSTILKALVELARSGELWDHLAATTLRMLAGFLLGGTVGWALGLLMGWSRSIRLALDPIVASVHPLPKIAILPLLMIIFGLGELSKIVAVAIAVFFPVLISTLAGVMQIPEIHFAVAKIHQARSIQVLKRVVLPGSLPTVLAGIRLGLNTALLITIAVELVAARRGMGAFIWLSWEIFRTEYVYVSLLVIGMLGVLSNLLLQYVSVRMLPWKAER
jgi:ABC-type nitrate/sulfonate/bicarbonate transport system permease component